MKKPKMSFGDRVFERVGRLTLAQVVGGAIVILAVIILVVAIRNSPSTVEADVANLPVAECPSDDTGGCVLAVEMPQGFDPRGKRFRAELRRGGLAVSVAAPTGDLVFHEVYGVVLRDHRTRFLEVAAVDQVDFLVLVDPQGPAGGWKVVGTAVVYRR